ncbi:MAG: toprim domain-containing protein, partial [Actinobacteria bacterium]|nr:toprim domain-containing protein [Actinomycetota bacterium]
SEVIASSRDAHRELVLVEGLIDFHQLKARSFENVAALGGTSTNPRTFERLRKLGVETVTLCLDNDEAGRTATMRAVENSVRAQRSPTVYVISPERLDVAKDPDVLVRSQGTDAWRTLLTKRECGIVWRAGQLVADVEPNGSLDERREGLSRAGTWLGALPARLSLEQEDAVRAVAKRCGYTVEAVERAFRARYWSPQHSQTRSHEAMIGREL